MHLTVIIKNTCGCSGNSRIWILLFFKWFYELANPLYQELKLSIFSVFIGQTCCVHTYLYVPPIRAGMRDTSMNPDEEFTVFKIVFYEILIMCEIKLTEFFTSLCNYFWIQHLNTPKVDHVGLLTFRTIRFLYFRYVQRIVKYCVLTQAVPRINLIKISRSQVYIFIIFNICLSGEFQCCNVTTP